MAPGFSRKMLLGNCKRNFGSKWFVFLVAVAVCGSGSGGGGGCLCH